ncbi:hypothetical protein Hypma_004740 [Hypsizygus marmoreus]|uniref:Uncharacterized protein n=1 Tax=Hypsizygus marmoreus TaxID=39966 RepID=A0A369J3L7_HYPMA|nr:hypothetical protein Hypma_004740 [Hypsizygus marmoreus]
MATIACGYIVQQEYMKNLLMNPGYDDYSVKDFAFMADMWWRLELTAEQRAQTPPIKVYARDIASATASCVFFILTRRTTIRTPEQADELLCELESDRIKKRKFVEVFGRGFQESEMVFSMKQWKSFKP